MKTFYLSITNKNVETKHDKQISRDNLIYQIQLRIFEVNSLIAEEKSKIK